MAKFIPVKDNSGWAKLSQKQLEKIQLIVCTEVTEFNSDYMDDDLTVVDCDAKCGRQIFCRTAVPKKPPKVCAYCYAWLSSCEGTA